MDPIDKAFNKAVAALETLSLWSVSESFPKPPLDTRVELYGLYRQATSGDVVTAMDPPGADTPKWAAWKKQEGLSRRDAKKRYLSAVTESIRTYGGDSLEAHDMLYELEYYKGTIDATEALPRSTSPAVSLYRVASSGFGASVGTKPATSTRNSSGSDTTTNYSTTNNNRVSSYAETSLTSSLEKDINFIQWQGQVNEALGRISKELRRLDGGRGGHSGRPRQSPSSIWDLLLALARSFRRWCTRAKDVILRLAAGSTVLLLAYAVVHLMDTLKRKRVAEAFMRLLMAQHRGRTPQKISRLPQQN